MSMPAARSANSSTVSSVSDWLGMLWCRDVIDVLEFLDEVLELLGGRIGLQKLLHDLVGLMVIALAGGRVRSGFGAFCGLAQGLDLLHAMLCEGKIMGGVRIVL